MNATSRGFDRPKVQVLTASVTTGYDADGWPIRTRMSEGGETAVAGVPVSASLALRFDRLLLPHRVLRQSVCIRPSTDVVDSIADCVNPGQPFAAVEYNPVLRTVFYRLPEGDTLQADTRYRVTIFATDDSEQSGFFAFDGAPLDRKYVFDFETAADAASARFEALPSPERYCDAVRCFDACGTDGACKAACRPRCVEPTCFQEGDFMKGTPSLMFDSCAFGNCHAAGSPLTDNPDPSVISMGLDLFTRESVGLTAIGKVAHQTMTGEASSTGDQAPRRFGRAMPLIDPNNPANSYLLYKVLVNPLNHRRLPNGRLADPSFDVEDPGFAFEIDRLRDTVVMGLPMPAQSAGGAATSMVDPSSDPLGRESFQRMLLLNTWIANGAVLSCDEGT